MLSYRRCDCSAKTLADDNDALRRDLCDVQRPGDERDAVGDEATFSGVAGGVAEASVIGCEDVDLRRGTLGESTVSVGAPTLGDGAGVTVNCECK